VAQAECRLGLAGIEPPFVQGLGQGLLALNPPICLLQGSVSFWMFVHAGLFVHAAHTTA
jgi:hypothetical protein